MMKHTRRGFGVIAVVSGLALGETSAAAAKGPKPAKFAGNKAIVREAFARQNRGGSFYDILDERVTWTVVNGRTYRSKHEFLEEGSAPVLSRLKSILRMTPSSILEDDDTIVTQFTGDAVAADGLPYHNDYCWVLTFRRGLVVRAHAYLDMVAVGELIDRVEPKEVRNDTEVVIE